MTGLFLRSGARRFWQENKVASLLRRKKYFVNRGLQLRFARVVIFFAFVSSLVTGVVIFGATFMLLGEKLANVYPQGRLVEIFRSAYAAFFISMLIMVPFIFYGAIVFSHRIAGPLPKIYEALRQVGGGNFDVNLILRKRDELRELANVINEMAKNLRERETRK